MSLGCCSVVALTEKWEELDNCQPILSIVEEIRVNTIEDI